MKRQSIQGGANTRCTWSKLEDRILRTAVRQYKSKGWNHVASYLNSVLPKNLPSKNSNQCRERWSNQLNPEVQLSSLSRKEIQLLFSLHKEMGNRWSSIASKLPGRTDNVVKNWFLCKLRKLARCIKKQSIRSELPNDMTELQQTLYMLDYLYKYYLSLDRHGNIAKSLNSQIKKRKNDGDRYINKMAVSGMISAKKLSLFVKSLLSEISFSSDKRMIQEYEYLLALDENRLDSESSFSQIAPSDNQKNETIFSTLRNNCFNI